MKFTKNGVTYDVRDQAHIDCFRAKGWEEVTSPTTQKQTEAKPKK